MMKSDNKFNILLRLRKTCWQAGLALAALLFMAGTAGIVLLSYGLFDFFLALPEQARVFAGVCIIFCFAGLVISWLISILKKNNAQAAGYLDSLAGGKEILSALELQRQYQDASEFKQFLIDKVLNNAQHKLNALALSAVLPWMLIRKRLIFFASATFIIVFMFVLNPVACKTISARIFQPGEDIPPYSRLQFAIFPDQPSVIYGQDIEVKVNIDGDTLKKQVFFITRNNNGKIIASPCFHETGNTFIQRLEKVTSPVQFCFQTGRARSRWHEIKLKLQPLFASVKITIVPPRYTGITPSTSFIGPEGVTAMKGSNLELAVTSNRPLAAGELELQPGSGLEPVKVKGERKGGDVIIFNWCVVQSAKAKVRITDIQGITCNAPFEFTLNQRLDQEPEVAITEPQSFMLATPNASIDLAVSASDDLGLKRIDLIKSINNFKDRIYAIGPDNSSTSFSSRQQLNLGDLGVTPGQILEFSVEAFDTNPSLTGYAISDPVKIQIISEDKYAQMLRDRTTFEELSSRYKVLFDKLSSLRRTVDETRQAFDKDISGAAKSELLEKLKNANTQAIAVFKHFSSDFPIYEIEKKHQEVFREIIARLEKADAVISELSAGKMNEEIREKLDQVILIMEDNQKQYEEVKSQMYELESFVAVATSAMHFRKIVEKQLGLVMKLKIFTADSAVERLVRLPVLAKLQDEIIKELESAVKELNNNAKVLSMEYFDLRDSAYKFMKEIEQRKIPEFMRQAESFAANNNGLKAHENARAAFDLLDELLKKDEAFQNLCQGKCKGSGDMAKACQQILDSLRRQMNGKKGGATGEADGGMIGGDVNDGYTNPGTSVLNIPVVGPRRTSVDTQKEGSGMEGGLNGSGSGSGYGGKSTGSERMNINKYTRTSTESISIDEVPEQYRQAVKQYLGGAK